MKILEIFRHWYSRFERPISLVFLLGGFIFSAITLKRVDTFWENFWILAHLVVVGVIIAILHSKENESQDEDDSKKPYFWYVNILQFFFGGMFSTYLVLYFRSADILVTWPFILILVVAFVANEALKDQYARLSFQISLFFLSIYSFAIFLVPVLTHQIGGKIFLLSGLLSVLFIAIFVVFLFLIAKEKFKQTKKRIFYSIVGIFAVVNTLYFTNLIPPIPLSLKDAGVYHSLYRNGSGNYVVEYEPQSFRDYFNLYQNFSEAPGTPVYAFSAIFSPSDLNTTIVHEWEYYDKAEGQWISKGKIYLPVIGGRDGGFRTFSAQSGIPAGKWRVNVETLQGQLIGRLRFNVVAVSATPVLATDTK